MLLLPSHCCQAFPSGGSRLLLADVDTVLETELFLAVELFPQPVSVLPTGLEGGAGWWDSECDRLGAAHH